MTTTPPLPRASDQAAERALFEAAEIAYWQSQQPAHADPLTDKEKAYLLRPNTWDKTSYEACDGRWQGWQWRAAIAHSAAQAPEGDNARSVWQVQYRHDYWVPVVEWDHGHTIPRDTFDNLPDAMAALVRMESCYDEHAFRVQPLAATVVIEHSK